SLVASLGGDDFAYLDPSADAEEMARSIIPAFETAVRDLHDPEDVAAGGFVVKDRRGDEQRVRLAGVAASLVTYRGEPGLSVRTLLEACDDLLDTAKRKEESSLAANRRALNEVVRARSGSN